MTDRQVHEEGERVRRALRDLPAPPARPGFRERLGDAFEAGRVERPAIFIRRPWWPRLRVPLLLAAPALAALVLLTLRLNAGPAWELVPEGDRTAGWSADLAALAALEVDGRRAAVPTREALDRLVSRGGRLRVPESAPLRLHAPGLLVAELIPGTELTLPAPPNRWFGRERHARIERGEMRVSTMSGFRGARLDVATPELEVHVTGTSVSIERPEWGTCVCVLEGTVMVSFGATGPEPVPAGRRFTVPLGEAMSRGEMMPEERVSLGALRSLCAVLDRGGPRDPRSGPASR